jgi:HSP20 family protein
MKSFWRYLRLRGAVVSRSFPPATIGFNASATKRLDMSRLREALGNLPDSVFVDVLESDEAYLFVVDVPGASADSVDVRVEGRTLAVDARRQKAVPAGFDYHSEERSLFLDLELPLPPDATEANASASVDDGVLEVRLPKRGAGGHSVPIEG